MKVQEFSQLLPILDKLVQHDLVHRLPTDKSAEYQINSILLPPSKETTQGIGTYWKFLASGLGQKFKGWDKIIKMVFNWTYKKNAVKQILIIMYYSAIFIISCIGGYQKNFMKGA